MTSYFDYYTVTLDEELPQVERAIAYYIEMAKTISASTQYSDSLTHYYRKLINTEDHVLRFRALFFAMRLQPVLSYVQQFVREQGRPPYILDLGCRFGLETILITASGAKTHGVDFEPTAIEEARLFKAEYERDHSVNLDIEYEAESIFQFKTDQAFDAVYSSATMHHIEPAGDAVQAVTNLIKPGGYFFLSDENGLSPAQQLVVQKRIGWIRPRTYWMTNAKTQERFLYGNENIRPVFVWAKHMRKAGLEPQSIKYCRFLPAVGWSVERLVKTERRLRNIPGLTQLGAIGFLLTACKPT